MAQVEFMPRVKVYTPAFDTVGPSSGNSVSYNMTGVGTWTWSAEGSYEWMWLEGDAKAVAFLPRSRVIIEDFTIMNMSIDFDRRPNSDKIAIAEATLRLGEAATYDLSVDDVVVTIDGVVIFIPAGSFVGSAGKYEFKSDGEPKVGMKLNFNDGVWSLKVGKIDASAVNNYDGVDVTLTIGFMSAVERINMRVGGLTYIAGY